eukprot:2276521-Rhodomonas_salina.3
MAIPLSTGKGTMFWQLRDSRADVWDVFYAENTLPLLLIGQRRVHPVNLLVSVRIWQQRTLGQNREQCSESVGRADLSRDVTSRLGALQPKDTRMQQSRVSESLEGSIHLVITGQGTQELLHDEGQGSREGEEVGSRVERERAEARSRVERGRG